MGLFAADKRNAAVLCKKISDVTFPVWLPFICKHRMLRWSAFNLTNTLHVKVVAMEMRGHRMSCQAMKSSLGHSVLLKTWRLLPSLLLLKSPSHYPAEFELLTPYLEHMFLPHMDVSCAALFLCVYMLFDPLYFIVSWCGFFVCSVSICSLANSNTLKVCC